MITEASVIFKSDDYFFLTEIQNNFFPPFCWTQNPLEIISYKF